MKYLIAGGVAAGTKVGAKIKRCDRSAEVLILTKGADVSYAGCGLPYYIGGYIQTRDQLIVNTPQRYTGLTGVEVRTGTEVTGVDPDAHAVTAMGPDGEFVEKYDKLVIATGAESFVPPVEGIGQKGVFTVRTPDDAEAVRAYVRENGCRNAVVCGAGFIGLEVAENLHGEGLQVTVIDAASQVMPNALDPEMADYAKRKIKDAGIRVLTGTTLTGVTGDGTATGITTNAGRLAADVVIVSIGVRPATAFLEGSGIETFKGTVVVDEYMATNKADVYAVGDCAMVKNMITGQGQWSAMGSTANICGRALAQTLTGTPTPYPGCLGTGVCKVLNDLNVGRTGLTEAAARAAGYDVVTVTDVVDDKAHYYPGGDSFLVKLVADRASRKLLGIQVMGAGAVDKMTDIVVAGIIGDATVDTFDAADFAYAPPFSTAIHPLVTSLYILQNKMSGEFETFTPAEYAAGAAKGYAVIDAQPQAMIPGATWVDLTKVDGPIDGFDKDQRILLVCAKGKRGYFMQNRLKALGYTNTRVLEGGQYCNVVRVERTGKGVPASEVKRLKGLGCLQDKRFDDVFNVRVITRNGKVTSAEQRAVAECAEKYGSGEVTMTTRLTLEIQGVPYDNVDAVFEFLAANGLETGGTGSKVRPVVSCKGTTCQYGLIDTFELSQRLHEVFYEGYHDVVLPHKFKLAVGGCPNNCVKPDLNDLGIIGQVVPEIDPDKCRGCKVCQVQNGCPIKVAEVVDGKVRISDDECNHCGRCVGKCPFGAVTEGQRGYKVYVGGRWGKKVAHGQALDHLFTSEQEVIDLTERAILFFRDEGMTGERFADTVDRLGFDYVQDKLLHSQIKKDDILKKTVVGGATC